MTCNRINSRLVTWSVSHCIYLYCFFLFTADFGDFDRYDSQEFLQKFALFPIVSIWFIVRWITLQMFVVINYDSVVAGLDTRWASVGRSHSESCPALSVLQVNKISKCQLAVLCVDDTNNNYFVYREQCINWNHICVRRIESYTFNLFVRP